jgi:hypothetical protein
MIRFNMAVIQTRLGRVLDAPTTSRPRCGSVEPRSRPSSTSRRSTTRRCSPAGGGAAIALGGLAVYLAAETRCR